MWPGGWKAWSGSSPFRSSSRSEASSSVSAEAPRPQPIYDGGGDGIACLAAHVHADVSHIHGQRLVNLAAHMRAQRDAGARRYQVVVLGVDVEHRAAHLL